MSIIWPCVSYSLIICSLELKRVYTVTFAEIIALIYCQTDSTTRLLVHRDTSFLKFKIDFMYKWKGSPVSLPKTTHSHNLPFTNLI